MELQVGKKVFLKPVGNAAHYGINGIREEVILKIGKKYFSVGQEGVTNEKRMLKFHIQGLRQVTNLTPSWELHFTKQEILDEYETEQLLKDIRNKLGNYGKVDISLPQLRKIKEIISE